MMDRAPLYNRAARQSDLDQAEQRLTRELASRQWASLGRHNHYFLALVLSSNRAEVVRRRAEGQSTAQIASALGVTPERVDADLESAQERMKRFCETRPHWLPWRMEYEARLFRARVNFL